MNFHCSAALLVAAIGAVVPLAADAAPCSYPYANKVRVTCEAADGTTEAQNPKGQHGPNYAPPGTDCNSIPVPNNQSWLYCLRTVQFNFHWEYDGPEDTRLVSVHREITNSLGVFPEERVEMVEEYWGQTIKPGTATDNAYKQIVVDLCERPIAYRYDLDVTIADGTGGQCTDTASYVYDLNPNAIGNAQLHDFANPGTNPNGGPLNNPSNPSSSAAPSSGLDVLAERGKNTAGIALYAPYLLNFNRAGPAVVAASLARSFRWFHTCSPTLSQTVRDKLPADFGFVAEISTQAHLEDIQTNAAAVPYGSEGVMAFCGGGTDFVSTSEAATAFDAVKRHGAAQAVRDVAVCARSKDWLQRFIATCPGQGHSNCDFDVIAITSNACTVPDLEHDIQEYAQFGKRIWVKGVECRDDRGVAGDLRRVATFLSAARVALNNHPLVERWSVGSCDPDDGANKADDGIPSADIVNGEGLTSTLGAAAAGLDLDPATGAFPCEEEKDRLFIKKYRDVEKEFIINGEPVVLSKTKKKKKPCDWLYALSQSSNPEKQLKFNKMCDNEKKATDVCVGTCSSVCRWAEALN